MDCLEFSFGEYAESVLHEIESKKPVIADLRQQGIERLKVSAQGLPATLEELQAFFADDLQAFGTGEVKLSGIRKACEWYAYSSLKRSMLATEIQQQDTGMVRCTECKQDRCQHIGRQHSPLWRWCTHYTAKQ